MDFNLNQINRLNSTKPLTVVFCLPGNSFSDKFLQSWSELLMWCVNNNIRPLINCQQGSNIYHLRAKCLGADVRRGKYQQPFGGQVDYDFIMWLDSDQVFSPAQFERLLNHNVDVVSGLYLMANGTQFACVQNWDEQFYEQNGYFQFLTPKDIENKKDLIEVSYNGMGFFLIKKGVIENLEYPWFMPTMYKIGDCEDFDSEDVAFCKKMQNKGYKLYVDPCVVVGHEKKVVL